MAHFYRRHHPRKPGSAPGSGLLLSILAVTTTVSGALGMGLAMTFVLVCSNIIISALRKVIPAKVHLPCYIVIIATFVTIVQMLLQAYM